MNERVKLNFMVVPELLATMAYVPDSVRCKVIDADAIFLTGILGESGRELVKAGIEFYFTRTLAESLIAKGIAVETPNPKGGDEKCIASMEDSGLTARSGAQPDLTPAIPSNAAASPVPPAEAGGKPTATPTPRTDEAANKGRLFLEKESRTLELETIALQKQVEALTQERVAEIDSLRADLTAARQQLEGCQSSLKVSCAAVSLSREELTIAHQQLAETEQALVEALEKLINVAITARIEHCKICPDCNEALFVAIQGARAALAARQEPKP